MSEEEKQIMNKMIYCNLISGEQALKFNSHIKEILQENEQLKAQLQQKENIIKEVREWAKKHSCQFTNDDGELVVSEVSFNIQARPCDLFKILDKGE